MTLVMAVAANGANSGVVATRPTVVALERLKKSRRLLPVRAGLTWLGRPMVLSLALMGGREMPPRLQCGKHL